MKPIFLILSIFFISTLAKAQQWELKWQGGTNYTFLADLHHKEEANVTPCPPSSGYCQTIVSGEYDLYNTFDSKWGGYGQLQLAYKLNEKWNLQYGLGSQLQRYQRHVKLEYTSLYEPGAESPWNEPYYTPSNPLPTDPETGKTRLWYLRHQAGATYLLSSKLALNLSGWADVLLQAAEYQMKFGYNNQMNMIKIYGEYDKSGAGFKHTVAGLQAGLSYTFLPKLDVMLSYSRSLTPQYKKTELPSPGNSYANQLQFGLAHRFFER